ncbi:MAG: SDR family oxidoreductase [Nitriliruptoraceae bacterium]|nr:SDR family oxidoreductase [Nitriliruptoraceae bacterium]
MHVLVIGSTRGTGRLLVDRLLADGHDVRALVRRQEQADALAEAGATPVLGDLEGDLGAAFEGALDAVAFCAGSGSSTGPDATLRVDLHGAVRAIDHCLDAGVGRYVQLSSIAADDPLRGAEGIRHYLAAMHARDRILTDSGLAATIVRPGGLTDDDPTGHIEIGVPRLEAHGSVPRGDVAAVIAGCLGDDGTIGASFEFVSGTTPIGEALAALR